MDKKAFALAFLILFALALPLLVRKAKAEATYTQTFYSSTSDGYLDNHGEGGYTYIRGLPYALAVYTGQTNSIVGQHISGTAYYVFRAALYFDTSQLPLTCNITTAILSLYVQTDSSTSDFNVTIQNGQPIYPHNPLVSGDYNLAYYSGNGGSRNSSSISGVGYWNITLKSAGKSWISTTGTTKLMLRSSKDINNIAPTTPEGISFYTVEQGQAYAPKLIVTYTVNDECFYILHGAYNETGFRDGNITTTIYPPTTSAESFVLDGEENLTYANIPMCLRFTLGYNLSRVYYLTDTFEEIYAFKPTSPYYTYLFTIIDFVGITNPYLESILNINGTDRIVERWKVTSTNSIPLILSWGTTYKIRLVCDQGTTLWEATASSETSFTYMVTSANFPPSYVSFGQNVSLSITRQNATYIQAVYVDGLDKTNWMELNIETRSGIVAYTTNNTGSTQTINWYSAGNETDYIAYVTISHQTLGTLYWTQVLVAPSANMTSPFDFSFLGSFPLPLTQVFGGFIVLLFAGVASTKNAVVGLFVTICVAALLTAVGILALPSTLIIGAMAFVFLYVLAYRKRVYG